MAGVNRRRINRVAQKMATRAEVEYERALERMKAGTWDWRDFRLALGQEQLDRVESWLVRDAVIARQRREAGEEPVLGDPHNVAANILSFRPDEQVPDAYPGHLRDCLEHFGRFIEGNPMMGFFLGAGASMLVLKTPDGIELRRRIWADGDES